ncbi:alginate O-acetyltransferase AlgX-related protein [Variovorax sp. PAMC26660]|uniref:alginate O-acetyltransferase AlgX-related protein n=1 Tax=Variovorax sp. PAMC26660 TaxID=2762322 RepID=UPI00164D149D|nr:hypothetical protein [Variovorax sp. PAMC26660]QNK71070.1 hypothetical protein H7F35_15910 [Variovorax sp. PAMC26660]
MRSTATRRIFIAAFLILTLLPGLQMATRLVPELEIDEQRTLAAPPSMAHPDRYLQQTNSWFSDHFGFRALLIRLKATIDYRLFRVSDKVHVGRDGYLFYRSTLDVEKPIVDTYLQAHEATVVEGVRRYAEALQQKGIGMVMVVNLLGDRFLPDKLPTSVAERPPLRRIDSLLDKLKQVPNVTFIDSTAILQETERSRPIFHRTDFHWNDPAAYPVAKSVVDAMSRAEGLPGSTWTHPLLYETHSYSGGIARFMPLLRSPSEKSIFVTPTWQWPSGFASVSGPSPYTDVSHVAPGTQGLLHPVLFVGDSFMDAWMRNGMAAYFESSYRLRWGEGLRLSAITAAIPPDARWVAVQFIEVQQAALHAFADEADVARSIKLLQARTAW